MSFITAIRRSIRKRGAPWRSRLTNRQDILLLLGLYFLICLLAAVLIWDAGVFYRSTRIKPHVPDGEIDGLRRDIFTDKDVDKIIALLNERRNQYNKLLLRPETTPLTLPMNATTTAATTTMQ